LDQYASFLTGQQAHSQVIGQCPGREPDGGLFAEGRGHRLFKLGDHSADGVFIRLYGGGKFL